MVLFPYPVLTSFFPRWHKYAICLALLLGTSICKAEKITIYTDEWPPYNFTQQGKIVGISTEIITSALDAAEVAYELRARPWARAYKTVVNTPNTAIFTIQRSSKREELFKWAGPIVESNIYLYRLQSRADVTVSNFDDLKTYRTGVLNRGAVYQFLAANGLKQPQLHLRSESHHLLDLIFAGRVDLIPGDHIDLNYQLNSHPTYTDKLEPAFLLYKGDYHIAFNKAVPDKLINKIQQALDNIRESGLPAKAIDNYIGAQTQ